MSDKAPGKRTVLDDVADKIARIEAPLRARIASLEQEIAALKLPENDRNCPFCKHPDYETRGVGHYLKNVPSHGGVLCTDSALFLLSALKESNAKVERLKAPVSDAEISAYFWEEDGVGSFVTSIDGFNAILAARAGRKEGE